MKKYWIFNFILIVFLLAIKANAQERIFKDNSESLMENVKRQLFFPIHTDGLFYPRFMLNIDAETLTFEYSGTNAKETRSLIDRLEDNNLDTTAAKNYPRKIKYDWGGAKGINIGKGWGFTKKEVQKIDSFYGHHKNIIAFIENDVNGNGIMDYIFVRRVNSASFLSQKHLVYAKPAPGYELEIYEGSPKNLTFIYSFYLPLYTEQIVYYTNAKDRKVNILSYQVYDRTIGAYQIGMDSVFW